jgi:hypothetical protein
MAKNAVELLIDDLARHFAGGGFDVHGGDLRVRRYGKGAIVVGFHPQDERGNTSEQPSEQYLVSVRRL